MLWPFPPWALPTRGRGWYCHFQPCPHSSTQHPEGSPRCPAVDLRASPHPGWSPGSWTAQQPLLHPRHCPALPPPLGPHGLRPIPSHPQGMLLALAASFLPFRQIAELNRGLSPQPLAGGAKTSLTFPSLWLPWACVVPPYHLVVVPVSSHWSTRVTRANTGSPGHPGFSVPGT